MKKRDKKEKKDKNRVVNSSVHTGWFIHVCETKFYHWSLIFLDENFKNKIYIISIIWYELLL